MDLEPSQRTPTDADPKVVSGGRSLFSSCVIILVARAIWAVSLFAAMPIIIDGIGMEAFGIWESILAMGAAAALLQAVVGYTLLWQFSHHVEIDNYEQAKRLIRLGSSTTLLMFLVFVPLACYYQDAILQFLKMPQPLRATVGWLLPATIGLLALGGFNQTLTSALAAVRQAGMAAGIQVAGLLFATVVNVLAIWSDVGIVAMWYGALAGFLVTFAALLSATWRAYGSISLVPLVPTWRELSVLAPFASLLLVSNLALLCRDHLDKVILTVVDSANSTGHFALSQRIVSIIIQITVVVQLPLTAAIGASHARGDWKQIERVYGQASHWLGFLSCLAAIVICTLRTPLIITWLGQDNMALHGYLAATVWGTTVALAFSAAAVIVAKGIGRPGLETSSMLFTLVLTLASKPLAIAWLGPLGAVISSAASWGIGSALVLVIVHRETRLSNRILYRSLTVVTVAAALSILSWNVLSLLPPIPHRAVAAMVLGLGTLLLGILYWTLLWVCGAAPDLTEWLRRVTPARDASTSEHRRAA